MVDPKCFCDPATPMLQAMAQLNTLSSPKFILVADGHQRLLGTVTDGDIRRAILRGVQLSSPVSACMNGVPITVSPSQKATAGRLLADKGVSFIPVLDEVGKVIDVVTNVRIAPLDVTVILMAGGLGSRLKARTFATPKPLLKVAGKPILQRIVEKIEGAGFRRVYVAVNYLADQIVDFFQQHPPALAKIDFLREDKKLGTAGPLSLLPDRPTKPLLVANADLITETDFEAFLQFHEDHENEATVGAALHVVDIPYGVLDCDEHGKIQGIREKPRVDFLVNAGMYVLNPSILDLVPVATYLDMPELLECAMKKGLRVGAFPIHEYWIDIGRQRELNQAQRDWGGEWPDC
jgi:dTDP-glucose pyrophosphorylase